MFFTKITSFFYQIARATSANSLARFTWQYYYRTQNDCDETKHLKNVESLLLDPFLLLKATKRLGGGAGQSETAFARGRSVSSYEQS